MTPLRPRAIAIALFAALFVVNVTDALATHFRYATFSWERVLTHNVAGEQRYTVTFDAGWRRSFPSFQVGPPSGSPPLLGSIINVGSIVSRPFGSTNTAVTIRWVPPAPRPTPSPRPRP